MHPNPASFSLFALPLLFAFSFLVYSSFAIAFPFFPLYPPFPSLLLRRPTYSARLRAYVVCIYVLLSACVVYQFSLNRSYNQYNQYYWYRYWYFWSRTRDEGYYY